MAISILDQWLCVPLQMKLEKWVCGVTYLGQPERNPYGNQRLKALRTRTEDYDLERAFGGRCADLGSVPEALAPLPSVGSI